MRQPVHAPPPKETATLEKDAQQEVFGILDDEELNIKRLGEALIKWRKTLVWEAYERLTAAILKRRGEATVKAAILVGEGKLDVRLACCGIKPEVAILMDKQTQDRLKSPEKLPLARPDGTVNPKGFFDMNAAEKAQLLGDKGYIHKPREQKLKPRPGAVEQTDEAKCSMFDVTEDRVVLKSRRLKHIASKMDGFVENLWRRGELGAFKKRLDEVEAELRENAEAS